MSLDVARNAAVESGILADHFDAATVEMVLEPYLDPPPRHETRRRALGSMPATVTESMDVQSGIRAARRAVSTVLQTEPFRADPVDILDAGASTTALVYEIPGGIDSLDQSGSFHYQVRAVCEVRRFALLITRQEDSTRVSAHCSLGRSIRINTIVMRVFQVLSGAAGGVGAAFGVRALLRALEYGGAGTGLVLVGASLVFIGIAVGVGALARALYARATNKLSHSFRKLLTAIRHLLTTS